MESVSPCLPLATIKSTPKPHLEIFLSEVSSTPSSSQSFDYLGHQISDSQLQRDNLNHNRENLIDKLNDNIKARAPYVFIFSTGPSKLTISL